jgi:hypothetical protein
MWVIRVRLCFGRGDEEVKMTWSSKLVAVMVMGVTAACSPYGISGGKIYKVEVEGNHLLLQNSPRDPDRWGVRTDGPSIL